LGSNLFIIRTYLPITYCNYFPALNQTDSRSSAKTPSKPVVFCDFDGTITAVETFAGMLKEFAPILSAELMPLMYNRRLSLREGVTRLLSSIPSSLYPEIIEYGATKPLRQGFGELLDFLVDRDIPFVIISGGIKDMVEATLQRHHDGVPLIDRVRAIAAVEIDASGDYLRVNSSFEGDTELVAKVAVMQQYPATKTIAIGDSVTDINMALQADLVFARDRLVEYLETEGKAYLPWQDFRDVRDYLAKNLDSF
jgi:2-hydroxy-3-keto-5-methylthiopentenyl-1-phosphate phosphatase